jgi:DNA-binding phage protein
MGKTKISAKRGRSSVQTSKDKIKLKRNTGIKEINPTEELLNEELISRALWECLKEGDDKGFKEVISAYVEACKKVQTAKKATISRSTIYNLKDNPTIKTVAKVVHACV